MDLVLFTLLLELVNLKLNVKKGHTKFLGTSSAILHHI